LVVVQVRAEVWHYCAQNGLEYNSCVQLFQFEALTDLSEYKFSSFNEPHLNHFGLIFLETLVDKETSNAYRCTESGHDVEARIRVCLRTEEVAGKEAASDSAGSVEAP